MSDQTALALQNGFPAHLEKYLTPDVTADPRNVNDMGALEPSDIGMSFIKIVAGGSRMTMPGWGPTGNENPLPAGTLYASKDVMLLPVGSLFVPLIRRVRYIKWIGRPGDGQMEFQTSDKNDPRILKIRGLDFIKDVNTGKVQPPQVTKYVNFYVMTQFCDEPLILSFKRTSEPVGKGLTQAIARATKGMKIPMRCLRFKFETPKFIIDGAYNWHQFNYSSFGINDVSIIKKADEMYEVACSLDAAARGDEFEDGGSEPKQPEMKTITIEQEPEPELPTFTEPSFETLQKRPDIPETPATQAAPAPAPATSTKSLW